MEMAVVSTEETLHHYLRRHFERISEGKARQLAEELEASRSTGGQVQPNRIKVP